jgi:DnaJ-class molecular chaperone
MTRNVRSTIHYDELGILPTATDHDIMKAFLVHAKLFLANVGQINRERGNFNKVFKAYLVLSDPVTRRTFDLDGNHFNELRTFLNLSLLSVHRLIESYI